MVLEYIPEKLIPDDRLRNAINASIKANIPLTPLFIKFCRDQPKNKFTEIDINSHNIDEESKNTLDMYKYFSLACDNAEDDNAKESVHYLRKAKEHDTKNIFIILKILYLSFVNIISI